MFHVSRNQSSVKSRGLRVRCLVLPVACSLCVVPIPVLGCAAARRGSEYSIKLRCPVILANTTPGTRHRMQRNCLILPSWCGLAHWTSPSSRDHWQLCSWVLVLALVLASLQVLGHNSVKPPSPLPPPPQPLCGDSWNWNIVKIHFPKT